MDVHTPPSSPPSPRPQLDVLALWRSPLRLTLLLLAICSLTFAIGYLIHHDSGFVIDTVPRVQGDLSSITLALDTYHRLTGNYPTTEEGLAALAQRPPSNPPGWVQMFDSVPLDPWGSPYTYRYPSRKDPATFELFSLGPDRTESADDVHRPR